MRITPTTEPKMKPYQRIKALIIRSVTSKFHDNLRGNQKIFFKRNVILSIFFSSLGDVGKVNLGSFSQIIGKSQKNKIKPVSMTMKLTSSSELTFIRMLV